MSEVAAASPRPRVRRNALDLLTSQLVTWVLAVAVTTIQPRFIGPAGQGQLRLAYSLWVLADIVLSFGTATYLTLEMSRDASRGWRLVRPIIALRLAGLLAGWISLGAFLAVSDHGRTFAVLTVLVGLVTMVQAVVSTLNAAMNGMEQMRYPAVAFVAARMLGVALIVTFLTLGGGVLAISIASLVATGVNLVAIFHYARPFLPQRSDAVRIPMRVVIGGAVAFLVSDAALILYQQVDTIVISAVASEEVLGWYAAADQLFSTVLFVPTILMTSIFPVLGRTHTNDPEVALALVRRSFGALFLVALPVGLGVFAVGPNAAALIFGSDFKEAGPVLATFGIVVVLVANTILLGRYALATGRTRLWNRLMIAVTLLTIPIDIVLVPWTQDRYDNGAIGGALAYVITESILLAAGISCVGRTLFCGGVSSRLARTAAAGAVMLSAVWPIRDELLPIPIAVGVVVYAVAVVGLKAMAPEERELVRKTAGRLRRVATR